VTVKIFLFRGERHDKRIIYQELVVSVTRNFGGGVSFVCDFKSALLFLHNSEDKLLKKHGR
jgi:hypothetical protein